MRVAYIEGDPCSPKYLRGALGHSGFQVEMVDAGSKSIPEARVTLVSDVPAAGLDEREVERLHRRIEDGAGLLAVGGWTSLGRGGWSRHPIARLLPAHLEDGDDRVNVPSGLYLNRCQDHEVLHGLPWSQPVVLAGYNRVRPRPGAEVLLQGRAVERLAGESAMLAHEAIPLLMWWGVGRGRVGLLASDLAPHWSGGWTDWGGAPIHVGEGEELGTGYVTFVAQLVRFLASA